MGTGGIIRYLRTKNKLSAKELSRILNISESSISLYESGKRTPSISLIIKIADYFNVSTDFLLGVSDKQQEYDKIMGKDFSIILENIVNFLDNSDYIIFDGKIIDTRFVIIFKKFLWGILENMRLLI